MAKPVIVVHYHEIWLKGGNRRFFLSKLHAALKKALEGLPVERIIRPGDRLLIHLGEGAPGDEAGWRLQRVFGGACNARGGGGGRPGDGGGVWPVVAGRGSGGNARNGRLDVAARSGRASLFCLCEGRGM